MRYCKSYFNIMQFHQSKMKKKNIIQQKSLLCKIFLKRKSLQQRNKEKSHLKINVASAYSLFRLSCLLLKNLKSKKL